MIKLVDLELSLEDGGVDNEMVRKIGKGLSGLSNLKKLELNLEDNYIDNFGFGIMLEDLELMEEVVLNVVLNNIV